MMIASLKITWCWNFFGKYGYWTFLPSLPSIRS